MSAKISDQAIAAMLTEAAGAHSPPEGLKDSIRTAVIAAGPSSNQKQKDFPERRFRMTRLAKIAASILVAAAIVAAIVLLTQANETAGVAFADVVQPLLNARTATFRAKMKGTGQPDLEFEMMFMEPGRMRSTTREGMLIIFDFQQGRSVGLDPEDKTALVLEMQNMGKDRDLQSQEMLFFNTREYIRKALENEQKTVKYLGKQTIDGRSAVGYHISQDLIETTLWADVTTQSPIRIETSIMLGEDIISTSIMDHFAFNVELDEALFSLEIPEDYTRETLKIDASKPSEKDIVEMFRVWTAATDGEFPSALNMAAMEEFGQATVDKEVQKMEEELEKRVAEIEKDSKEKPPQLEEELLKYEPDYDIQSSARDSMAVVRGLIFASTLPASSDRHYAGKGVRLGEAGTAIFWYQPEGSQMYRVIYGDLSIREMAEEDLPR